MKLIKDGDIYVAIADYEDRLIPKGAGFTWNRIVEKKWATKDKAKAAKLFEFAEGDLREELRGDGEKFAKAKVLSRAATSTLAVPAPEGLEYYPFQKAAVEFAKDKEAVLFGDEMGLGKTLEAIGVINLDPSMETVLVICPASLKINWQRELEKWLVRPMSIGIADSKVDFPTTQIVIVNYDILKKFHDELRERVWDVLVGDEVHYLKNGKAQRTREVVGYSNKKKPELNVEPIKSRKRILLTGTPILNRPVELWTIVNYLDRSEWGSFWHFVTRYCAAHKDEHGFWDMTGASNLEELQDRLRSSVMVRRLKKDVLTELPAKVRQVIDLPTNGEKTIVDAENEAWKSYEKTIADLEKIAAKANPDEYADAVENLQSARQVAFAEMARVRHETAVAKIPHVIKYLENVLETQDKVVLFAHHHDVVEAIADKFGDLAVKLYGPMSQEDRQTSVDRFQNDPSVKLFVGSIKAAGVGLTLTAGSHVVFAELDWTPGNITQAEDRCHRIGQLNSVLIQHLVFSGSLDSKMARTLVEKQKVADAALDRETGLIIGVDAAKPGADRTAMVEGKRKPDLVPTEDQLTAEQVEAIHSGLKQLATMCDGAQQLDGSGFNKLDTKFGHSLAGAGHLSPKQAKCGKKMVIKYKRQLPEDLIEAVKGEKEEPLPF